MLYQSTAPFIDKSIENLSRHRDRLCKEEEEGVEVKALVIDETTKSAKMKALVKDLKADSVKFYENPLQYPKQDNSEQPSFFSNFETNIKAKEKDLNIPRNYWKPGLLTAAVCLTGVGLIVAGINAIHGWRTNTSMLLFAGTKSAHAAKQSQKICHTASDIFATKAASSA